MRRTLVVLILCLLLVGIAGATVGDTLLFSQVNISSNITQVWNNGTFQVLPVVQGVTTTDNIDKFYSSTVGTQPIGEYSGSQYILGQNITPTKSKISGVSFLKSSNSGSPTGDLIVKIRTTSSGLPTTTILASTTIPKSTWDGYTDGVYTPMIPIPCIVTPGTTYAITIESSVTEAPGNRYSIGFGGGSNTGEGMVNSIGGTFELMSGYSLNYIEYCAKNTESVNVTVNGNTTMLDTSDATGLLSGATVDGYNGVYEYTNGFNSSTGKFSDVFSSTEGGYSTDLMVINGWGWTNTAESIQSASDTTARNVTFKINTILPVTGLNITVTGFNNNVNTGLVELSGDGSTYTTVWDLPASASVQTSTVSTGHVNGNTSIYLRLSKDTTNGYIRWDDLKVVALVNTTSIETPALVYFDGTNTVNLTSDGRAVSSSLDPSLMANVSLIEGAPATSISADFTASNTSGIQPLLVQFTDTSTVVDATIDSWAWDFGDGNTSTTQSPSHTYEVPGTHTANLTITNTSLSLVSTKLTTITVYKLPIAGFSATSTAGTVPFTTYFFDTSTNLNAGPYTYYWDLGDGNTSTSQNLFYTYNLTGTFTVKHSVTDSVTTAWKNQTDYITVTAGTIAPVASFYGGPQLGNPPMQVFFTDVSTNTPTGWFWEFGDGTNSSLQNPTHWFNRSGFYRINLTVTNGAGSNLSSHKNFVMTY